MLMPCSEGAPVPAGRSGPAWRGRLHGEPPHRPSVHRPNRECNRSPGPPSLPSSPGLWGYLSGHARPQAHSTLLLGSRITRGWCWRRPTASTPTSFGPKSGGTRSGWRATARTPKPQSSRCLTTRWPRKPVAPSTTTSLPRPLNVCPEPAGAVRHWSIPAGGAVLRRPASSDIAWFPLPSHCHVRAPAITLAAPSSA